MTMFTYTLKIHFNNCNNVNLKKKYIYFDVLPNMLKHM